MTGTFYETWFTPTERARYEGVVAGKRGKTFRGISKEFLEHLILARTPRYVLRALGFRPSAIDSYRKRLLPGAAPTYYLHDWYVARTRGQYE